MRIIDLTDKMSLKKGNQTNERAGSIDTELMADTDSTPLSSPAVSLMNTKKHNMLWLLSATMSQTKFCAHVQSLLST